MIKMSVKLYMTTVTSSRETKSQQSEIMRILDTRRVPYESVDISLNKSLLGEMREKAGNSCAVPPQLFCGDKYIGDYQKIMDAVENDNLAQLLEVQK